MLALIFTAAIFGPASLGPPTASFAPQPHGLVTGQAQVSARIVRGARIALGRWTDGDALIHAAAIRSDGRRQRALLVEFP